MSCRMTKINVEKLKLNTNLTLYGHVASLRHFSAAVGKELK